MRCRTLTGKLLAVQAIVTGLACCLLVAGVFATGAWLLRGDQDGELRSLARSLCQGIPVEARLRLLPYEQAARELLAESEVEGYRFELWGPSRTPVAQVGKLPGGGLSLAAPGEGCTSWPAPEPASVRAYRSCTVQCREGYRLRASAVDVLASAEVHRVAWVLLGVLPAAVVAGTLVGMAGVRRLLRPLHLLREAATRLEPAKRMALGVRVGEAELADLERAMDRLLARLGEALERERRFTQEASHELRTPLTHLRLRLERLGAVAGPQQRSAIEAAVRDVQFLERLVDALLLLARAEESAVPTTPVNLCDTARELAASYVERFPGVKLRVEAPDEVLVLGSEELLGRALANLLDNAVTYAGVQAEVVVCVRAEGDRAVVHVMDDGPGIPDEIRPHVFERFVRAPNVRGRVRGTGLGLAVVRAVVTRHGGEVRAVRREGGGEQITIVLPLAA